MGHPELSFSWNICGVVNVHSTDRGFQFILSSCIITIFEVVTMPLGNNEGRTEMNQIKIGKFIAERRKERGFLKKALR